MKLEKKFYKVYEAANILGVGAATIRRWIKEGKLKGAKAGDKPNHPFYVSAESIDIIIDIDNKEMLEDKLRHDEETNESYD